MEIYTHFTRPSRTSFLKGDIEDHLSKKPKENLEGILNEKVFYGGRYQSFFCNKSEFKDFLPYMIAVTKNRLHENKIFLQRDYSHGIIFAPGYIESKGPKKIRYKVPDTMWKIHNEKVKLPDEKRKEWLLDEGYLYNLKKFNGNTYDTENESRIKLHTGIYTKGKGLGVKLEKEDIAMLIIPEAECRQFQEKYDIPTIPQEKINYIADARTKELPKGVKMIFPEDDFFLFDHANSYLERTNANYRWEKRDEKVVKSIIKEKHI